MSGVVVCSWTGPEGLPREAEELLTLGRRVAEAAGAELRWLVLGREPGGTSLVETAGRFGAAALDRIDDAALADFAPDTYVEALAQYCAPRAPALVLVSQSFDARLLAPRLAGRLGYGVVANAVDIEVSDGATAVTASAYGGDTRVVYALEGASGHVVALMANAVAPEPLGTAAAVEAREVSVDLGGARERIRVLEPARSEGPRLEDAEVIVAGGRGLGAPENFKLIEQLAEALGGMAGASRPLVDDGWVDSSRQVGLTGRITRPALYLAVGISGASQHMAGCGAAKLIAAINRDPDAAIFRYARYGIVGDCLEILPELIRASGES